jgi:hypothetical protein
MDNFFIVQNGLVVNTSPFATGSASGSYQLLLTNNTMAYMNCSVATASENQSTVIDSFSKSWGNTAKWLLSIGSGSNFKTSEVLAIWDPATNNANHAEYTTNALGTVPSFMSVNISGGNVRLVAYPTTGSWTVKMLRFVI